MLASLMPVINTGTFLEQFTYQPTNKDNPYRRHQHKTASNEPVFSNTTQTWTIAAYLRGLAYFGVLNDLDYTKYAEGEEIAARRPSRRGAQMPQVKTA